MQILKLTLIVFLALAYPVLASDISCPSWEKRQKTGYWMCFSGSRIDMLETGNLDGTISLENLPEETQIAVGPVEGLQGEITILEGKPFISRLEGGHQVVEDRKDVKAIFLGYGGAEQWKSIRVNEAITDLKQFKNVIGRVARDNGFDLDTAFPFYIEGLASDLKYHVIFKTDGKPHNKALHKRAKIMFYGEDIAFRSAGIWVEDSLIGHYTHPGNNAHLHIVVDNGKGSGHLDGIAVKSGWALYLPKR